MSLYGGLHPISIKEALHLGGASLDWSSDNSPLGVWEERPISLSQFLLLTSYPQAVPKVVRIHLASFGHPIDVEISELFVYGEYLIMKILSGGEECSIEESLTIIPGRVYPKGRQSYWVQDLQELIMPGGEKWMASNDL
jgi:hypothetical protein